MRFAKILLLSAAALSLAACGSDGKDPEKEPGSDPVPTLVEVDFNTFKAAAEKVQTSPYNKLNAHYRALGNSGSLPIDIDKNVEFKKKNNTWSADLPSTHPDYSVSNVIKNALDGQVLSTLINAYDPSDQTTNVKFYYEVSLGFKITTNGQYLVGPETTTLDATSSWNIYGDLTHNDSHTVVTNAGVAEANQDIRASIDLTYSTDVPPTPSGKEAEEINKVYEAAYNTKALKSGTFSNEETMGMGDFINASTEAMTFKDGELYAKRVSQLQSHYEIVEKVNNKFVKSSFDGSNRYGTCYVNEKHASEYAITRGFEGFLDYINFMKEVGSLDKVGDYLVSSLIADTDFTDYTANDYTLNKSIKVLDNGASEISISVSMKEEWLSRQKYEGMDVSLCDISIATSYKDGYLVSNETEMSLGIKMGPNESVMASATKFNFSKDCDDTLKAEIKAITDLSPLPENIENSGARISPLVNGYQIANLGVADYLDTTSAKNQIDGLLSNIDGVIASIKSDVNISCRLNGDDYASTGVINLSTVENNLEILVTPKEASKCVVFYIYNLTVIKDGNRTPLTTYKAVLVDKSSAYSLALNYEGVDYNQRVYYVNNHVSSKVNGSTFDISNLDFATFYCAAEVQVD